jgi:hypothetical protein
MISVSRNLSRAGYATLDRTRPTELVEPLLSEA